MFGTIIEGFGRVHHRRHGCRVPFRASDGVTQPELRRRSWNESSRLGTLFCLFRGTFRESGDTWILFDSSVPDVARPSDCLPAARAKRDGAAIAVKDSSSLPTHSSSFRVLRNTSLRRGFRFRQPCKSSLRFARRAVDQSRLQEVFAMRVSCRKRRRRRGADGHCCRGVPCLPPGLSIRSSARALELAC